MFEGMTSNVDAPQQVRAGSFAKSFEAKEVRPSGPDADFVEQNSDAHIALTGHVVAGGETLSSIASMYETTVSSLQELNAIYDPNTLFTGERLIVSPGSSGSGLLKKSIEQIGFVRQTFGTSAGGRPIESFQVSDGELPIILVGAVHGGYEWNTALLAYRILLYLSVYPGLVPSDVTLHIVPIANPDGIFAVTGSTGPFVTADILGDTSDGRMNGNGVDLNRNWGCDWAPYAQWRETIVSGGTRPISEPETRALRSYFNSVDPVVVIWLHSAAGLLVPGGCNGVHHEPSWQAASLYGVEAGYPVGEFTAYPVSGDGANWLAQHKIASFTVELNDHQDLEFERNLDGLLALLTGVESLVDE